MSLYLQLSPSELILCFRLVDSVLRLNLDHHQLELQDCKLIMVKIFFRQLEIVVHHHPIQGEEGGLR